MARIRSVHPGLMTDAAWVSLSPLARWFGIGLLMEADDHGVFRWSPLDLKMKALPGDNADVPAILNEALEAGIITSFEVAGRRYGAIRNFRRYQSPKSPRAVHPLPPRIADFIGLLANERPAAMAVEDVAGGETPPPSSSLISEIKADEVTSFPQNGENHRQRERRGEERKGEEEERKGSSASHSSSPAAPARQHQPASDPDFDAFWAAYPRKVGKDAARKAWAKARKRATVQDIAEALRRQRWPEDRKFVPHPATWLNQGRWQDDPGAAAPPEHRASSDPRVRLFETFGGMFDGGGPDPAPPPMTDAHGRSVIDIEETER